MWTRVFPGLCSIVVVAALLIGCSNQQPSQSQSDGAASSTPRTEPDVQVKAKDPTTTSQQAQAPFASPAGSSPAAGTEPRGRVVYAWHTAIAPAWFDPSENGAVITPYAFAYAMHDALVKHMPGKPLAPSLAESYEIAPDHMSATFKLREGITFHNGEPVTPEDVKFTFENYKGANARILHSKTERIETPDARTVTFVFKEPFLDFEILYGSPASGAGWILPKKYYEQVGPDGFKQHPIGAGPYKFVRYEGNNLELEAFTDYWRKTPTVKTLVIRAVPEAATRVAQIQTGEVDFINLVPGQLLEVVRQDAKLKLTPVQAGTFWLEFPDFEKPENPFHDKRVREAVSLAIDREALSQAEEGGLSVLTTNWIPEDWPGAIPGTKPEFNVAKAKQLMSEAGFPGGFELAQFTPLPPYTSAAERILTDLRAIGIIGRVNVMERGAFFAKIAEGEGAFAGPILNASGAPGDAASRIRSYATCDGANSLTCVPEIDEKFKRYEKSTDPREREQLLAEIQRYMMDNHTFVMAWRQAFISAQGPRIANKWEELRGSIPQYVYVGPYEDIRLTE